MSSQAGTRIVLKSHFGYEISKIDIYDDQYLIAHTPETLLMGDLESCKLSEVPWSGSGSEKFFFDNPQVCVLSIASLCVCLLRASSHMPTHSRTAEKKSFLLLAETSAARTDLTASNTDVMILAWPHNSSLAPWSSTPSLQHAFSSAESPLASLCPLPYLGILSA